MRHVEFYWFPENLFKIFNLTNSSNFNFLIEPIGFDMILSLNQSVAWIGQNLKLNRLVKK